jgi:hypothetical protein
MKPSAVTTVTTSKIASTVAVEEAENKKQNDK